MSLLDKIKVGVLCGLGTLYVLFALVASLAVPVGVVLIAYHLLTK